MGKVPAPAADPPTPAQTPFEQFAEFTRKVLAVPRSELEEQERVYKEKRAAERKRKP
jgi:hypothetical protein